MTSRDIWKWPKFYFMTSGSHLMSTHQILISNWFILISTFTKSSFVIIILISSYQPIGEISLVTALEILTTLTPILLPCAFIMSIEIRQILELICKISSPMTRFWMKFLSPRRVDVMLRICDWAWTHLCYFSSQHTQRINLKKMRTK